RAAPVFELESLQYLDHRADMADANPCLRLFRECDGCAHFNGDRLDDFIVVRLVGAKDSLHERQALLGSGARIGVECAARSHDGTVDVLGTAHRYDAGYLFGGGIDDLEFLGLDRVDPSAIDVKLPIVVCHARPLKSALLPCGYSTCWQGR